MIKRIYDLGVMIGFIILLILNQISLNYNISDISFLLLGLILALFRALYFNRYVKMKIIFPILIFITFSVFVIIHTTKGIDDLVLTRYLKLVSSISALNIFLMIYLLLKGPKNYIFNSVLYIFVSILISIEYIPNIVNLIEIFSYIIFLIIYLIERKVNIYDKK